MKPEVASALVEEFKPTGEVLELACGDGAFTRELARQARTLTAIDASPRMLARNREQLAPASVKYINADLFSWTPDRRYDAVFFGFWLSHVPPPAFDAFWTLVQECLRPGGRVAFVDEDDRARGNDELRLVGGVPAARRTLSDGRQLDVVKVFWDPSELEERLRKLNWDIKIRRLNQPFMYGVGRHLDT